MRARTYLFILALYFLLQIGLRVALSDSLNLDEAEQVYFSQSFEWGYGTQPPLYNWIQQGLFQLIGTSVFSLAFLKNLCLFATYLAVFLTAKAMTKQTELAVLASTSLLFIPQIVWESQRDLTHSVLATALTAFSIYACVGLRSNRTIGAYTVLGLLAGLGLLSKYSYAPALLALLCAALTLREWRPVVLNKEFLATLGLSLLVFLPHGLWILAHAAEPGAASLAKFKPADASNLWQSAVGIFNLSKAILLFLSPLWLVYLVLFPAAFTRKARATGAGLLACQRLFERGYLFSFLILASAVILFHATYFKDRWMQPFLISVPVYFIARLKNAGTQARARIKTHLKLAAVVACVVPLVLLSRVYLAPWTGRYYRPSFPFAEFAAKVRSRGFSEGYILSENTHWGGNMRFQFPRSRVLSAKNPLPSLTLKHPEGSFLLLWDGRKGKEIPEPIRRLARIFSLPVQGAEAELVGVPYKHSTRDRMLFGMVLIKSGGDPKGELVEKASRPKRLTLGAPRSWGFIASSASPAKRRSRPVAHGRTWTVATSHGFNRREIAPSRTGSGPRMSSTPFAR